MGQEYNAKLSAVHIPSIHPSILVGSRYLGTGWLRPNCVTNYSYHHNGVRTAKFGTTTPNDAHVESIGSSKLKFVITQ